METLYLRTPFGDLEITARQHQLTRWQRATLIVIGTGKRLADLHHELRQMPEKLEHILHVLVEKNLVTSAGHSAVQQAATVAPTALDPLKEARRYLTYLISIIDNADASAALILTISVRNASSWKDIETLRPAFLECLDQACGPDESRRLLDKLTLAAAGAGGLQ